VAHPHLDQPTTDQLVHAVANRPEAVREVYLQAHHLIADTLPDIGYRVDLVDGAIGYGAHQYGYNGWGMAAITPHATWVTIVFTAGARLVDPMSVLDGTGAMRHVKLASADRLAALAGDVRALVLAASRLHAPSKSG
jgi:hypothetical protein